MLVRINLNEGSFCFDILTNEPKETHQDIIENALVAQYNYRKTDETLWASVYEIGNEIARYTLDVQTGKISLHPLFQNNNPSSYTNKSVDVLSPNLGHGRREIEMNCLIDRETEKAVHVVKYQTQGVMRTTVVDRWFPKSWLLVKQDGSLLIKSKS